LQTAKAWGIKSPSQWDRLSKEDRAEMLALQEAENIIESWTMEQQMKDIDKPKRGKRRR